jgi:hypothetical protein
MGLGREHLVNVAPAPPLSGLERSDHRMLRRMKMLGRVLILRVVATTNVTALEAEAQMHPLIACRQAFFAALRRARVRIARPLDVFAELVHAFAAGKSQSTSSARPLTARRGTS